MPIEKIWDLPEKILDLPENLGIVGVGSSLTSRTPCEKVLYICTCD